MVWTDEHEVFFCREIIVQDLFQHKDGSRERGQCLDKIADCLNAVTTVWFKVDQRSLRDKINKLIKEYVSKKIKKKMVLGSAQNTKKLTICYRTLSRGKKNLKQHIQKKAQKKT